MSDFKQTSRTTLKRRRERGRYDRKIAYAILDEGFMASVAATIDGWPYVQPMLYARDGDRVILHGSSKHRLLDHFRSGAPLCLNVSLVDGLSLGRSIWSGVVPFFFGVGAPIPDPAVPVDEAQLRGPAERVREYKRPQRHRDVR